MSDLRRKPRRFEVSGQGLKYLSAGLLLLYNIGRTVLERGIIRLDSYIQTELLDAMAASPGLTGWVGAASVIGLLGGIATPLYAFLLVEVFLHTSNYSKYLLRVAVLAGTSEFVYDFAMTGNFSEFSQQNPALGLAVCLIQLYIMQMLEWAAKLERSIGSILAVLCAAFWALLLRTEYGLEMVLLTAIFYCFREHTAVKLLLGVLLSLLDPLGPLAFCGIALYNGKREAKPPKYTFYLFYCLHFLLLSTVTQSILR